MIWLSERANKKMMDIVQGPNFQRVLEHFKKQTFNFTGKGDTNAKIVEQLSVMETWYNISCRKYYCQEDAASIVRRTTRTQ